MDNWSAQDIITAVMNDTAIQSSINDLTSLTMALGGGLGVSFLLLHIGWLYMTGGLKGFNIKEMAYKISGGLLILFFIGSYKVFMAPVDALMMTCAEVTKPSAEALRDLTSKELEIAMENSGIYNKDINGDGVIDDEEKNAHYEDLHWTDKVTGVFSEALNPMKWIENTIYSASLSLMLIIRVVLMLFSLTAQKILFIFGPLAACFSILPIFKDKLTQWFNVYVNVGMILTTINILDYVVWDVIITHSVEVQDMSGEATGNPISKSAFFIMVILFYCMSPWLTSQYAGSNGAAQAARNAVDTLKDFAQLATMAGGGGAAGSMAPGGSAGDMAQGLSDSIKHSDKDDK